MKYYDESIMFINFNISNISFNNIIFILFCFFFMCILLIKNKYKKDILHNNIQSIFKRKYSNKVYPLLYYNTEEENIQKLPRLFAICGQSVIQENGELNLHLRNKFLEVSNKGDYGIFAGTPEEKNIFLKGYNAFKVFKIGDVTFNLYNLESRTICCLREHHSRKSIHNCVEVLYSLIGLKSINISKFSNIHVVMYDKSQCIRTSRIISLQNNHYEEYIKNNTEMFSNGDPLEQCKNNKERLRKAYFWYNYGSDVKKLFKFTTDNVSLIFDDSCFHNMIEIFSNNSNCYHIGSLKKETIEKTLVWKWGAGYNYEDLCDLLPDDFKMDGKRQTGSSDSN